MIRWITSTLGTGAYSLVNGMKDVTVVDVRDLLDRFGNSDSIVKVKIDEVVGHLRHGRVVVVCCDYGMSRSNAVAAGALSVVEDIEFQVALGKVRERTGETAINVDVIASVRNALAPTRFKGVADGKVLVTGGSGFLGVGLAARAEPGTLLMPPRTILDVRRSTADLDDYVISNTITKVVHLAAPRVYTNNEALGDILVMLKNVIDVCVRHGLPLIMVSSWVVYSGYTHGNVKATEELELLPDGTYGHARALAEDLVNRFRRSHGLKCTILRCSPVLGHRNHQPRFIYRFIERARRGEPILTHVYENGEPHLDLVWRDDVIDALLKAIDDSPTGDFNIGSGVGVSTREIARFIIAALSSSSHIDTVRMEGAASHVVIDSSKAAQVLGFVPKVTWQEAVGRIIQEITSVDEP